MVQFFFFVFSNTLIAFFAPKVVVLNKISAMKIGEMAK